MNETKGSPDQLGQHVPSQEQPKGTEAESRRGTLMFEGVELFKLSQEQIANIRTQMDSARTALKADLDSIPQEEDRYGKVERSQTRYKMALEGGVKNKSYQTVRWGGVGDYRGETEIEINKRKYKAIGHGPEGTAEYISENGFY